MSTKNKRLKVTLPPIKTREEMERLVGEIRELTINRDGLTVSHDTEIAAIDARYEEPMNQLKEQLDAKMLLAQDWAENNPAEFGARKSIEFVNGTVGFRTGQPKLARLAGWTWDRILEAVGRLLPDYVRIKQEVDRERIIADRETLTPMLKEIGVKIEQDEAFFVEPKRDAIGEAPQAA